MCGQHIEVNQDAAGQSFNCPTCDASIVAPVQHRFWGLVWIVAIAIVTATALLCGLGFAGLIGWKTVSSVTSLHRETEPAKTAVPITGAFGWWLGDKLPVEYKFMEGSRVFYDNSGNSHGFVNVEVDCLKDRTIYRIQASSTASSDSAILEALNSKYGPGAFSYDDKGHTYVWQNGQCRLTESDRFLINVIYENMMLSDRHGDEIEADIKSSATNLTPQL
jgi:hypothetical protein